MLKRLLSALLVLPLQAAAQNDAPKPPRLFEDDTVMQVTLTGPWRQIMRNKDSEEKHAGSLSYTTSSGETRTLNVELKTRGLTRRDKICDFPPLKVYFDKDDVKGTEFRGQKSLKMVTYCQTDKRFEQYNISEFLAYRFYNLITAYSFRVRPLLVAYQDTGKKRSPIERFGFLIEDVDRLAKRLDLQEVSIKSLHPNELHAAETAKMSLFQYFISNLDWAATAGPNGEDCCHNGKLIAENDQARPVYAIPYDFDSSGLVNAHYAAPPTQLGVRKLTQRRFRGFCQHNEAIPAAVELFREQRPAITRLADQQPRLTSRTRSHIDRLIQSFYDSLESDGGVRENLIDTCRG